MVCSVEDGVCDGEDETVGDETAEEDGVPTATGGGLWCELASTAMPALAPAMTITAAAASTGAKARLRPPRLGRGSRPRV